MKRYTAEDQSGCKVWWEGDVEVYEVVAIDGQVEYTAKVKNQSVSGRFSSVDEAFKVVAAARTMGL